MGSLGAGKYFASGQEVGLDLEWLDGNTVKCHMLNPAHGKRIEGQTASLLATHWEDGVIVGLDMTHPGRKFCAKFGVKMTNLNLGRKFPERTTLEEMILDLDNLPDVGHLDQRPSWRTENSNSIIEI